MAVELTTDTLVVVGVMALTALFIGWLGYRIRYRGDVYLVAGYREDDVSDPDGVARLVGTATLVFAAATLVFGVLYPLTSGELAYWGGYLVVAAIVLGYVQIAGRKYQVDA
jgi:hypothetical protein